MSKESKNQQKQRAKNAAKHAKKAMKMLREYDDVTVTDSPSRCLFIGNGGMLCGVNRESLLTLLESNGAVVDLVLLPKKSFALAIYDSLESAQKAIESLDGYVVANDNPLQSVAPLYVKYLDINSLDFAKEEINGIDIYPREGEQSGRLVDGLECVEEFISEDYEKRLYEFFYAKCQEQQGLFFNHCLQKAVYVR